MPKLAEATARGRALTESEGLRVPSDVELVGRLSSGYRCVVYEARYRNERIVLKVYKPYWDEKCRRRVGMSAAQFEYDRNQRFHSNAELRPYVSRPLFLLRESEGWTEAFGQEFVDGMSLTEFRQSYGELSVEFAQQVKRICQTAWSLGLYDLDLHNHNVLAVAKDGRWRPMLFDFNMLPKHLGSRLLTRLLFRLGLRDRAYRDRRWLKDLFARDLVSKHERPERVQIYCGRVKVDLRDRAAY